MTVAYVKVGTSVYSVPTEEKDRDEVHLKVFGTKVATQVSGGWVLTPVEVALEDFSQLMEFLRVNS